MSRTKKVTRARRHIAALQSKLADQTRATNEALYLVREANRLRGLAESESDYLRDQFAPHLAKLATVTVGLPWERYDDQINPDYLRVALHSPPTPEMPMVRVIRTPTIRSLQFSLGFSREMIEYIAVGHEEAFVREMAKRIQHETLEVLIRIVPGARRRRSA